MPTATSISDDLIHKCIVRAVENVCTTMLKQDAGFVEKTVEPDIQRCREQAHIFGCVGFVGKLDGVVYLCFGDDFAADSASRMLGMSPLEVKAEGDEVINDVVGEMTNMTVGCFKNALCDFGFPCKLTLPTIVRGQNLVVASIKEASRHIFNFECNGHRLVADIQMKLS